MLAENLSDSGNDRITMGGNKPPAIERFFMNMILCMGSAKLVWNNAAAASVKAASANAAIRVWKPMMIAMPPSTSRAIVGHTRKPGNPTDCM